MELSVNHLLVQLVRSLFEHSRGGCGSTCSQFKYMGLAIVFPELLLFSAFGQNVDARGSVERFKKLGFTTWTLQHAFYANMGGVMLDAPDYQTFPINASQ